jgi:hypothetical protein
MPKAVLSLKRTCTTHEEENWAGVIRTSHMSEREKEATLKPGIVELLLTCPKQTIKA